MIQWKEMAIKQQNSLLLSIILILAISCGCCTHHRPYVPKCDPQPLPSFYVPENIRIALVLGSGGVRGMAHVGVLEELVNAGIPIDLIVGCSAGSLVGALYADNPNVETVKQAVWKMRTTSLLDINLLNCCYGLSQGHNMLKIVDDYLTAETFEELGIPLVVVASDLHTGELVPIGSGDLVKAIRASCSIPFVFVPCEHMDRILVDGGVINPVPVKVAKDLGAQCVIAVDLCELLGTTFPTNLFQVAARSAEIAFMWQNEVCTRNADVVIRPRTCGIGTFDDTMKWEIYQAGKKAAREQLDKIKEILAGLKCDPHPVPKKRLVTLECYAPQISQLE
jgi:NTE family protein